GVVVSMIGLLLVLNLRGSSISIFGVVMAMAAAVCLASYFLVSAKDTITLPPVALTGLGMGIGSLAMSLIVLAGIMPAGAAFGVVVSMIGLLLVLNLRGSSISIFGVVMAMAAAVCLASYFLVSAKDTITLPPVALTGLGMGIGSLAMSLIVLAGIMPAGAAFG